MSSIKLVERRIADFSTYHITLQDISQLTYAAEMFRCNKDHYNIWDYDSGFFIYCGNPDADFADLQARYRFSEQLMKLLRMGCEGGFAYINVDQDGTHYSELESLEWDESEYTKFYSNCMHKGFGALADELWISTVVGDLLALGVDVASCEAWLQGDNWAVTALNFFNPTGNSMTTNPLTEANTVKALRWLMTVGFGVNRQWRGTDARVNLCTNGTVTLACDSEGLDFKLKFNDKMEVTFDAIQKRIRRN